MSSDLNLVFINSSQETFTPTQSGAIATVVWELCQAARRQGIEATVITREAAAPAYPWPNLIQVNYPAEPTSKVGILLCRAERRFTGWRYLRQRQYAMRVVKAIKQGNDFVGSASRAVLPNAQAPVREEAENFSMPPAPAPAILPHPCGFPPAGARAALKILKLDADSTPIARRCLEPSKPVFVLNNDPELAVVLRRKFPAAQIVHCFHNQHECKPAYRRQFGAAVDMAIAVSDFTAKWVTAYYALPPDRVRTAYNGVDLEHFSPAAEPPSGPVVINFLGRTGIEKGPDVLLDAGLLLSRKTQDFSLQLIGSNHWDRFELDDYQRLLNDRVAKLESRGIQVRRPGHVSRENLPSQLRQARINVVPARWDEPFGLTTLEGMACGLATVASRTGGTPEVVGDAGILFERESVAELAEILERLIRDDATRNEYGQRARQRAELLSWDRSWATLWSCCR